MKGVNEIVEALKLHIKSDGLCYNKCEYVDRKPSCTAALAKDALEVIVRLANFNDLLVDSLASEFQSASSYKGYIVKYVIEKKAKELRNNGDCD